jgi:hypothetical protein
VLMLVFMMLVLVLLVDCGMPGATVLVLALLGLQQCCSHRSAAVQLWRMLQAHVPSGAACAARAPCWKVTQLLQVDQIKMVSAIWQLVRGSPAGRCKHLLACYARSPIGTVTLARLVVAVAVRGALHVALLAHFRPLLGDGYIVVEPELDQGGQVVVDGLLRGCVACRC